MLGAKMSEWEWGKLVHVIKMHTILAGTVLESKYEIRKRTQGNRRTVNFEGINLY